MKQDFETYIYFKFKCENANAPNKKFDKQLKKLMSHYGEDHMFFKETLRTKKYESIQYVCAEGLLKHNVNIIQRELEHIYSKYKEGSIYQWGLTFKDDETIYYYTPSRWLENSDYMIFSCKQCLKPRLHHHFLENNTICKHCRTDNYDSCDSD